MLRSADLCTADQATRQAMRRAAKAAEQAEAARTQRESAAKAQTR